MPPTKKYLLVLAVFLLFERVCSQCASSYTRDTKRLLNTFANIGNLPTWWDASCDACDWHPDRIECDDRFILYLNLDGLGLTGELELGNTSPWPEYLRYLSLYDNQIMNTILDSQWSKFPPYLQYLDLGLNEFAGNVVFDNLPDTLIFIYLSDNQFDGSLQFTDASSSHLHELLYLYISNNDLAGSVPWVFVPSNLRHLCISHNALIASIDVSALPAELQVFEASHNMFTGHVDLLSLPHALTHLLLHNNVLSGVLDFSALPETLSFLSIANNDFGGIVDLSHFASESLEFIYMYNNQLSGTLEFASMGDNVHTFIADGNQLSGELDVTDLPGSMRYLWVYDNEIRQDALDLGNLPDTLEQLLIFSNNLTGTVSLSQIQTSSLTHLALHDNRITGPVNFLDIPDFTETTLDLNVFCDISAHCEGDLTCTSMERTQMNCTGPDGCSNTCICDNCTIPTPAPEDLNTLPSDWHAHLDDASLHLYEEGEADIIKEAFVAEDFDFPNGVEIPSNDTTSTEEASSDDKDSNDGTLFEQTFGSAMAGYVAFIGGFLFIILSCFGVWYWKHRKQNNKFRSKSGEQFGTTIADSNFEMMVKSDQTIERVASLRAEVGKILDNEQTTTLQTLATMSGTSRDLHIIQQSPSSEMLVAAPNAKLQDSSPSVAPVQPPPQVPRAVSRVTTDVDDEESSSSSSSLEAIKQIVQQDTMESVKQTKIIAKQKRRERKRQKKEEELQMQRHARQQIQQASVSGRRSEHTPTNGTAAQNSASRQSFPQIRGSAESRVQATLGNALNAMGVQGLNSVTADSTNATPDNIQGDTTRDTPDPSQFVTHGPNVPKQISLPQHPFDAYETPGMSPFDDAYETPRAQMAATKNRPKQSIASSASSASSSPEEESSEDVEDLFQ